jgi:hypothetical protein
MLRLSVIGCGIGHSSFPVGLNVDISLHYTTMLMICQNKNPEERSRLLYAFFRYGNAFFGVCHLKNTPGYDIIALLKFIRRTEGAKR